MINDLRYGLIFVALLTLTACNNGDNGLLADTTVGLQITSDTTSIPIGLHQQEKALATMLDGSTKDITTKMLWSSSDDSIATIDNNGDVMGLSRGNVTLTALFSDADGKVFIQTAELTVSAAMLNSITISYKAIPLSDNEFTQGVQVIPQGLSVTYTATGDYSDGIERDITEDVFWHSSNIPAFNNNTQENNVFLAVGGPNYYSTISASLKQDADTVKSQKDYLVVGCSHQHGCRR